MKFRLVVIFIFITAGNLISQSPAHQAKIDSILTQLDSKLKPKARIAKHLKLVRHYKFSHPDVDSLLETALTIAQDGGFKFYEARSLRFRARYRLLINEDSEEILSDIQRIEKISAQTKNKLIPGWISELYAEYYIRIGDLSKANEYIDSFSVQINNNKFTDKGSFHTTRGMYYLKKKNYPEAISEFNIALTKRNAGRTYIYNNLGELHLELLNPEKAIEFANKSLDFANRENNVITKIQALHILGEAQFLKKDTTTALEYFNHVEELRSEPYLSKNYSSIHRLIDIYKIQDISKVDNLLEDISSYKMVDAYSKILVERGIRHIQKNEISLGLKDCKEALQDATNRNKYEFASYACDCLIDVYRSNNNKVEEAYYLTKKLEFQSKIQDEKRLVSLARNLTTYETEKEKALLNQAYEKDQEIMSERIGKYKLGGLLGLIIISIGGIALWMLRKRNRKIKSQNKVITKALKEKDILLREIHHRVKNNLQLVSSILTLQGRSVDNETAAQAINEGKNRVRSMALIHQDLYNKESITGISVGEYLSKLTSELFATYNVKSDRIKLVSDIEDLELDIDTLVPLGLIINELFSNCLKYAFPDDREGSLSISLREINEKLVLKIKDNGIGFDQNDLRENSFGNTLISALTEQLEGEIVTKSNNGTEVNISFSDYKVVE